MWLPDSGKPFDQNDGSLLLENVAKLLKHSPERILKAILIQRGQKIRVVAFDKFNKHRKERRICALGGHFFLVKNPIGAFGVCLERAIKMQILVHETDSLSDIRRSDTLSCMNRPGGINTTVRVSKGYRSKARWEIEIVVAMAVHDGVFVVENRISEVVYCLGEWNKERNWYDGSISFSRYCKAVARR